MNYNSLSNVYSYGYVIYEILHGRRVWKHLKMDTIIDYIKQGIKHELEVPVTSF